MVGYHHQLRGHEPEQTPGDSEGQGRLACCSPWGRRVRHNLVTEERKPNMGNWSFHCCFGVLETERSEQLWSLESGKVEYRSSEELTSEIDPER